MRSVVFLAVAGLSAVLAELKNPSFEAIKRDLSLVKNLHAEDVNEFNSTVSASSGISSGSYITTVYTSMNCKADTKYTASGYNLGSCIAMEGRTSVKYTECVQSGGKTTVTMTYCQSSDCEGDCETFKIPQETGCQSMSEITCSSSSHPWSDAGFNYHAEFYFSDNNCGGQYDMWTAINIDEDDCNDDMGCSSSDDDTIDTTFSMEGFCDA